MPACLPALTTLRHQRCGPVPVELHRALGRHPAAAAALPLEPGPVAPSTQTAALTSDAAGRARPRHAAGIGPRRPGTKRAEQQASDGIAAAPLRQEALSKASVLPPTLSGPHRDSPEMCIGAPRGLSGGWATTGGGRSVDLAGLRSPENIGGSTAVSERAAAQCFTLIINTLIRKPVQKSSSVCYGGPHTGPN